MITVVTTHKFPIFKLFYEHRLHNLLKEDLILYVDKEDPKELQEFFNIVDLNKTRIFTRKDIIEYYKDLYLSNTPYCKKMYFINMIAEMGLLNDTMYMTDDDILLYDNSLNDIIDSNQILYDKEPFPKVDSNYSNWKPIYEFFKKEMGNNPLHTRATNFFIPKNYVQEFVDIFIEKFSKFVRILKNESDHIDYLNAKSKSKRGCDWSVFYIEVPFFGAVFSSIKDREALKFLPIYCVTYSELRKLRDKHKTVDNNVIMKYFCERKPFPQKQSLLHFNIVNKEILMSESFNYLNYNKLKYQNVNDLLFENPKERKKLERQTAKSLF